MQAKDREITEFVGKKDLTFLIPSYQRNYKWQFKSEVKELLDDITEFIEDSKNTRRESYFLGSVVTKIKSGINSEYTLVDGQQRITTFLLMVSAIYEIVKDNETSFKYKVERILETEEEKFKLRRINDEQVIKLIISGKASYLTNSQKETQYYKVFKELVLFFKEMSNEKIEDFFEKGISKLVLAVISLDENEDEFLVFESINSKGQPLSSADLIKNYLMMCIPSDDRELEDYLENVITKDFTDSELSDFYRQVFASITGKLAGKSGKTLYYAFKKLWSKDKINKEFFDSLNRHSLIWKYINNTDFKRESYPLMKAQLLNYYAIIHNIVLNNSKVEHNDLIIINQKNIDDALMKLSSVVIRRMLFGRGRVESNRTFAALAPKIVESNQDKIDDTIIELSKIDGMAKTPEWKDIESSLDKVDVYSSYAPTLKWTLIAIEESKSKKKIETDKLSVEHIFPQTPSNDWELSAEDELEFGKLLNTLGNLSITNDNSALGNKLFAHKQRLLDERSYLKINKSIYEIEDWTPQEVKARAKKVFESITNIWK